MNEHGFVRKIHKKLRETGQLKKIWKINDNFQGGVPDAFYLAERGSLWVEYKYLPVLPKRDSTIVVPDLSELQFGWLADLQASEKQAWVVVGHPEGVWVTQDLARCREGIDRVSFVDESIPVKSYIELILCSCVEGAEGLDL